jgi:hypothetical protein
MLQKDFARYWKERKKNKYYSKCVPTFNKKKTFMYMLNELANKDFRKLDIENRKIIMGKMFGITKLQFKNVISEIDNSIRVGYNVKIGKTAHD